MAEGTVKRHSGVAVHGKADAAIAALAGRPRSTWRERGERFARRLRLSPRRSRGEPTRSRRLSAER